MNTARIFKSEINNSNIWKLILIDLDLPAGTDEITITAVTGIDESQYKQDHTVHIVIKGGAVQSVSKPQNIAVEVHDYDVEGLDVEDNENFFKDEDGNYYQKLFWDTEK